MDKNIATARPRWFRLGPVGLLAIMFAVVFLLTLANERRERLLLTEKVDLLESRVQTLDRAVQQDRSVAQRHKLIDFIDAPRPYPD